MHILFILARACIAGASLRTHIAARSTHAARIAEEHVKEVGKTAPHKIVHVAHLNPGTAAPPFCTAGAV